MRMRCNKETQKKEEIVSPYYEVRVSSSSAWSLDDLPTVSRHNTFQEAFDYVASANARLDGGSKYPWCIVEIEDGNVHAAEYMMDEYGNVHSLPYLWQLMDENGEVHSPPCLLELTDEEKEYASKATDSIWELTD
jgi:hypothetical protein